MYYNEIKDLQYSIFPDKNMYLTYTIGDTNIILSAPHGGNIRPRNVPKRTYGNLSRDMYTRRLLIRVAELMVKKPYFIYANIHRNRIDLNRGIKEGCQGNLVMEETWRTWNKLIALKLNDVRYYFKKGLYIDIHSHNNNDSFQIGYGLPVNDYIHLMNDDKVPTKNSTMHSLKEYDPEYYKTEFNILFGENSIPAYLEKYNLKVLKPTDDKHFLNGGYNILKNYGNGIGSMQIECPISVLKNNLESVAYILVKAIENFQRNFLVVDK